MCFNMSGKSIQFCFFLGLFFVPSIYAQDDLSEYVNLLFITGSSPSDFKVFPLSNGLSILTDPSYDPSLPTVFYFHGWSENAQEMLPDQSIYMVVSQLIPTKANIICLDYANLVQHIIGSFTGVGQIDMGPAYASACNNITIVATPLANFFNQFVSECNCLSNIKLIGFSIGAQCIGLMAKQFTAGKFPVIHGLEPAGPIFNLGTHLDSNDATFVNVIHTDAGAFGFPVSCGDVDFWANNGIRAQPGCDISTSCSHYCAVKYFANSISNPTAYPANKCDALGQDCQTVYMGYSTNPQATGKIFLSASG